MGKRITQLDEITTIDNNDILYGVDVDDLTHSPEGTSKKFTKINLLKEINSRAGDIESDVSDLQGIVSGLLDWFYPLGTIYETTSVDLDTTTKMDAHFGGTWEVYGVGRVLVAKSEDTEFDTIGETGGVKEVTLTSAQSGLPAHTHLIYPLNTGSGDGYAQNKTGSNASSPMTKDSGVFLGYADSNTAANASESHTNLQPYIVVYRYRRTA